MSEQDPDRIDEQVQRFRELISTEEDAAATARFGISFNSESSETSESSESSETSETSESSEHLRMLAANLSAVDSDPVSWGAILRAADPTLRRLG
jgi:hypothetical protein